MKQIDLKQYLDSLTKKDRVEVKRDISELKKRIWERVTITPVPGSSNHRLGKPLRNLEGTNP